MKPINKNIRISIFVVGISIILTYFFSIYLKTNTSDQKIKAQNAKVRVIIDNSLSIE